MRTKSQGEVTRRKKAWRGSPYPSWYQASEATMRFRFCSSCANWDKCCGSCRHPEGWSYPTRYCEKLIILEANH